MARVFGYWLNSDQTLDPSKATNFPQKPSAESPLRILNLSTRVQHMPQSVINPTFNLSILLSRAHH